MASSRAQHQILDQGTNDVSVAAGVVGVADAFGTEWPLLPGNALRIYHVSANFASDDGPGLLQIQGAKIECDFQDANGNAIASLWLAGAPYTTPTPMSGAGGSVIYASGDPLIHVAAGFLIANNAGVVPAQIQFFAFADVLNTDAVNPHTVTVLLSVLLSFPQL